MGQWNGFDSSWLENRAKTDPQLAAKLHRLNPAASTSAKTAKRQNNGDVPSNLPTTRTYPNPYREGGPNLSEMRVLGLLGFPPESFESRVFHMANGHDYTPDACDGKRCLEVKGFRHHSIGRSRLAFDQCKKEFPEFDWLWVERKKTGKRGDRWQGEFPV